MRSRPRSFACLFGLGQLIRVLLQLHEKVPEDVEPRLEFLVPQYRLSCDRWTNSLTWETCGEIDSKIQSVVLSSFLPKLSSLLVELFSSLPGIVDRRLEVTVDQRPYWMSLPKLLLDFNDLVSTFYDVGNSVHPKVTVSTTYYSTTQLVMTSKLNR